MTDAHKIRQTPTDAMYIANGDPMIALDHVDALDAGMCRPALREVVDALRYWIGEAHDSMTSYGHCRNSSELSDGGKYDVVYVRFTAFGSVVGYGYIIPKLWPKLSVSWEAVDPPNPLGGAALLDSEPLTEK